MARGSALAFVVCTGSAACGGCDPLPAVVDAPDVVVGHRGEDTGHGRLLSMQLWVDDNDYATVDRFNDRVRALFVAARERELLDDKTIVVLPEYAGSWLVAVDEGADVVEQTRLGDAMTDLALAHLPSFLFHSWTASVDDGDAFAAFTEKADAMAAAYDTVFGGVAGEFDVVVVAGSILLPGAHIEDGHVKATPGEPLQNVSVIFDADGKAQSIARKGFPTKDEQGFVSAALDPSEQVGVIDTAVGKVGVVVCADSWFPESYAALKSADVELLAVPTFHSGNDLWNTPWNGYSGHDAPDDVDEDDVGVLSEAQAWDKYALAARARAAGFKGAVSAPLRGSLWDLGADGQAFLVDAAGFERMQNVDAPALWSLELP